MTAERGKSWFIRLTRSALGICFSPLMAMAQVPMDLQLTVDFGPSGQDVAQGAIGLGTSERPQSIVFDQDDGLPGGLTFTVSILNVQDTLSFVGILGGPLGGDFVIPDEYAGGLRLEMSGLPARHWHLTTFHNTSDEQRADFDILVNDVVVQYGAPQSSTTDDGQLAEAATVFTANGTDPIIVDFQPVADPSPRRSRVALNGMILEPSENPPPPTPTPTPTPSPTPTPTPTPIPVWDAKPYLLLDSSLIVSTDSLERRVMPPRRLPYPIVNGRLGQADNNNTPYLTVLRDPATGRFRLWYNVNEPTLGGETHLAYMESNDGINWERPHQVLSEPVEIQFGVSVIDDGPNAPDPSARYKNGFYARGGTMVTVSSDGINWRAERQEPIVYSNHDITAIHRDPIRNRYLTIYSVYMPGPTWEGSRRIPHQVSGTNIYEMSNEHAIILPDEQDEGETQFYCMAGVMARGELLLGLVKILRDEVIEDPTKPSEYGVGWTELAWTRDGENWTREHQPLLPRNPIRGSWDYAMTWGDGQLVVGEETWIYYGGYERGHKVERYTERQLGLARMKRDRYIAWIAGTTTGTLRTATRPLHAGAITLNADIEGTLRARLVDAQGEPLTNYDWLDGNSIRGDSVAHALGWSEPLESLRDQDLAVELAWTQGEVYALEFASAGGEAATRREVWARFD